MGWHTVQEGDCLSSLAEQHALADWRSIYNHPDNSALQQERPNPNVLAPGDRVFVPDRDALFKDAATDLKHTYVLARDKTTLRIVAADEDGRPYQQLDYQLTIDKEVLKGKTDDQGLVQHVIDAQAASAVFTLWWPGPPLRRCTWRIQLGHLDPVGKITGIQARLNNLGHKAGPVDEILGPVTRAAVRAFQEKYRLRVDGIPGPITQARLEEMHGCETNRIARPTSCRSRRVKPRSPAPVPAATITTL